MSLTSVLGKARTEEDVKDAYISALNLKRYTKGLIDIQTEEIWFEAKEASTSTVLMFTQLLFYVRNAREKGESIPPFLAVIDREKAAIMETVKALPILDDKAIKWPKSGSKVDKAIAAQSAPYIETHFVVYQMDSHEKEFLQAVKTAITAGKFIRTPITPDNLRQVFDRWVDMIGKELEGVDETDYALLFFADIMHDGVKAAMSDLPARLLHDGDKPIFELNGKNHRLSSVRGYRNFWAIYHRPPEEEHRSYLLERRDSLLPLDERSFKGAYYTPLHVVDKAYDLLAKNLGENWQKNYIVWDMCCGVGNLEVKHSNHRNIYMSTLDKADIDVMKASRTCVAATHFQYDYLNDDITAEGKIDYSVSNKVPMALRAAIADGKKILVLINPPYAEATNTGNTSTDGGGNKAGVAKTKFASACMSQYGKASNELFTQFVARIAQEMPTATLAMFSKLKYVNAPTLEIFRQKWNAKYLSGFVVHSQAFDGLNGDFPIGFLMWATNQNSRTKTPVTEIAVEVLDKNGQAIGEKTFFPTPNSQLLADWIIRPPTNAIDTVPLKNAITPATATKDLRGTKWADGAIAWMNCAGNDLQNAAQKTMIFSSGYGSGRGYCYLAPLWSHLNRGLMEP
ncbi:hypothetical protein, partial [Propionivibrio sp.]|uniref:hypothetical protein n=1 Tax=Propionivibrio sp. TaxID=2212460 RepID=UPI003BF3436D